MRSPAALLTLIPAAFTACLAAGNPAPLPIFDGRTLDHWSGKTEHWRVEDGAITGEIPAGQTLKGNEWIFWDGEVHDFDLQVEFRITGAPTANSGIQFRSQQGPRGHASGYQADLDQGSVWLGRIYDEHGRGLIAERGARVSIAPDGRRWTDVFAEPQSLRAAYRPGEWNAYRITATASHVEVRVNDVLFSVLDDHQAGQAEWSGRIAFQLHSGPGPAKVQFRNVRLAHLGKTTLPPRSETKPPRPPGDETAVAPPPELNLGFEKGTLDGWTAEGSAWQDQPVEGDTVSARRRGQSRHAGRFWLGGYERHGDRGTGTLTSAAFRVTHPWASFLVGAAPDPAVERVEIVEEATGKAIHRAGGSQQEDLRRVAVDLRNLLGKRIFVRIVDQSTAGWGHVNFDDFLFHPAQPAFATAPSPPNAAGDRASRSTESPVLWHLVPNPAPPARTGNAAARQLVAGMKLTPGFQAELIAAEPDVRQPIAFCIDERGRLWVAEAFSYPNRQPEGRGRDRIRIFEDRDGDGSFEHHKTFIEGLNLVSGIEVGFGGVWIGAAPELLFIPRDAEDRPGPPQVLLDGWGYQDTHETLNSFTWGPDGWLYGNQGVFTSSNVGKPGAAEKDRISLRAGVWRYHPARHTFEVFCHGGSNQWGLDYNRNGHLFMTHCRSFWGRGGTTHAIRNGHFWNQANAGYAPFISATAPDLAPGLRNYLPASARYDSGEGGAGKPGTTAVYGGHSHVGTLIYQGDNWPSIYRDHLFTHNLHGHQMNHQHNVRSGSGYETLHAGYDLLFSADDRYLPVDLQTGPDGAVYVIDWCDTQHCHNPDDEKWDRSNGRVYRISWAATYRPVKTDLGALPDAELVELQLHANEWHARTARRLLQERAAHGRLDAARVVPRLEQLASREPLRSLWTLHGINHLSTARLRSALTHSDDIVRAWTVHLATDETRNSKLESGTLLDLARTDPSPTVRLALASALPAIDRAAAWEIGAALAMRGEDRDDRFLPRMIWFGLAPGAPEDWVRALALADRTPLPELADSIRWHAASSVAGREALVAAIATQPTERASRSLHLLAFGLRNEARAPMPTAWPKVLARSGASNPVTDQLSAAFGDPNVLSKMRQTLADDTKPQPQRRAAFDVLRRIGDIEATPIFVRLLDTPAFSSEVIPLLARSGDPATATAILKRFPAMNAGDRIAALQTLTSRAELALPLLEAVQGGTFDRKHLSALQIRQLRDLRHAGVDKLLHQSWGAFNESSESAKATIARLRKAYQSAPLWAFDARAGEKTFQQICGVCHAMGGVGGKLGPDLAGSWRNGLDYFLENIIDPNAVVGDDFQLQILTRKDGSVVSGVIEQETDTAIRARTVTEAIVIPKSEIRDRRKLPVSLMPPSLLEALPDRQALELLKYLLAKRG